MVYLALKVGISLCTVLLHHPLPVRANEGQNLVQAGLSRSVRLIDLTTGHLLIEHFNILKKSKRRSLFKTENQRELSCGAGLVISPPCDFAPHLSAQSSCSQSHSPGPFWSGLHHRWLCTESWFPPPLLYGKAARSHIYTNIQRNSL